MNHAIAEIAETTQSTIDAMPGHEPITGWHALQGLSLGHLQGLAPGCDTDVTVDQVVESCEDLAIADRVAYLHAELSGRNHVVLAGAHGYLVATLSPDLDWAAAMRLVPADCGFRITSVATAEGVLPVLVPA